MAQSAPSAESRHLPSPEGKRVRYSSKRPLSFETYAIHSPFGEKRAYPSSYGVATRANGSLPSTGTIQRSFLPIPLSADK
jgi:hypothetical protein